MFFANKNRQNETSSEASNLTGKRKRSEKDISRVKRNTAQKALQYEAMTDTGICVLGDGHYSVTLKLEDIDY